jgi:SH3-like domain-containing protein
MKSLANSDHSRIRLWQRAGLIGAIVGLMAALPAASHAQAAKGATGLPLPRFVSLKSKKVNLRVGPGKDYAVSWLFLKSGLPVEIIQEYDNWRRIRDADGAEGWVFHSLLSGDRSAIAAPWMKGKGEDLFVNMRKEPSETANLSAKLQPGVVIRIDECNGNWCHAEAEGSEGWVNQAEIWGAYPGEAFTR